VNARIKASIGGSDEAAPEALPGSASQVISITEVE
jgi:hypothetical protein